LGPNSNQMKLTLLLFLFFSINVFAQPNISNYEICDDNNDGIAVFDLTTKIPEILANDNPVEFTIFFYETLTDALTNSNAITTVSNYSNIYPSTQTVFINKLNNASNQSELLTLDIIANPSPIVDVAPLIACFNQGVAIFDLGLVAELIWAQNNTSPNQMNISFHNTLVDAMNQINPFPYQFTTQDNSTVIYISINNTITGCSTYNALTLLTTNCENNNCQIPTNVAATNIQQTTATLNWVTNDISWEIFITAANAPAPTATSQGIITSGNPFVISNLNCSTNYTFYVRSTCANGVSDWSSPVTFQTASCGQSVTVSSTVYTPTDILNNIVLNNECGNASNIITQGICGIGYFNNNDGDFPFEEGLVIRSGNVNLSGGTYTSGSSNSSSCSNLNDGDLNNVLVATGNNSGTINDATFIKFDFVPTSNLLTFNFLFASNEYGSYQCNFSDVFGFILTDLVTGVKKNIAVVPGTTTPISTTTVRNNLYNTACSSVNPQFFGSYNVNNPESDINFIGQTVPMTAFAQVIPNRQYSIKLAVGDYNDSMFDSAVFIEGGSFAFSNQCEDNIQLVAFIDSNNNGTKEDTELSYSQGTFNYSVNDDANEIENQSSDGVFYLFPENITNSYDISYSIYPELSSYFSTSTSYSNIVFEDNGNNIYYFPITNTQPYNDVEVSITSVQVPNPGFNYYNRITYKNNGITSASGTLQYNHDSMLTLQSVSEPSNIPITNGFTLNYVDLLPGEIRTVLVTLTVPTIPTVTLGQLVVNTVTSLNTNDFIPANNSFEFSQVIVGSYDPNDKLESHGGRIVFNEFDANDYLYYTIRFQNTGTANAQFVRLEDTLNDKLDETSIRMIGASHDYVLTRNDTQLTWQFNQINLPPQIVNNIGSNGYVQFKIKPKPGFLLGDVIPNTAEIYFDFNPAIVTNTFNTEFVQSLSNSTFTANEIQLTPNPAKDFVTINNLGSERSNQISIYEVSGKRIYNETKIFDAQTTINTSNFAKGIYLVEIVSENNLKLVKKLVIQ